MPTLSPTLAGLSLAEKRILLAQLLQEKAGPPASFPLSHGQRALWFLHQMDREGPAYNVCYPSRIRSPLDLAAFRRAVRSLVARHPSLRTTFEERDGELVQTVHADPPLPFEVVDATSWSEEALRDRLEREAHRPFDLESGPLVRMHLFSRAPDDHVFLLNVHHIVGDFWSLVLVIEDMQALYPRACRGEPASLPPPARRYDDFVRWQADLLAGPGGDRLRSYWEGHLAGVPTVLDIPADRPRPARFSRRGDAAPWRVGPGLARRLKALAASEGVTLYSAFLAAFQVLLGRYSGREDFLVGSPFAGRNSPGFEGVIGYFINMVPLLADLSGDPPFRELLRRVGTTVLDALDHQDYPFSLLVERLNVARDPGRTPLVQVTFTQEKSNRPAWRFFSPTTATSHTVGGLRVEPYHVEHQGSQADLEMVFEEGDGQVEGTLRSNGGLFEPGTARRMVDQFLSLLGAVADRPDLRLSDLPLLTGPDRNLVAREWNRTEVDFPRGACLHHLFESQAARTPDAIALADDATSLTYRELDQRANRLAHRLRRMGIGPGSFVALGLDRSPEMIVAILGALKAGAAYVPLDPALPADRARFIVADTGSRVLLSVRPLRDRLPGTGAAVVYLDDPSGEDEDSPLESRGQAGDLAYVIYTSGSTGQPKGVMVEHRAIVNTILWRHRDLPILPGDRVLFNVPYSFDPSLCLIFCTLTSGARLVLAGPGEEFDPHRLIDRVVRDGVTILEAPPVLLRLMVDVPSFADCRRLRWICCGGEAMSPDLPARLLDRLDVDFFNLYGPTEAAVDVTWWRCRRDDPRPTVPIGRPIANARAYVLDAKLRPVPPGIPGELYVGGAGLARGYLNDPALTADRFVPDPFGPDGSQLFRTGDRCRWLADGVLEFLGRLDHQVKVRGHRVELGEVEAALLAHPAIREAAVAATTGAAGESRLVAYVVGRGGVEAPPAEALRRHLRGRLPDYMLPDLYVPLPALPRSAGGKLDRLALPEPTEERPAMARACLEPRSPLESFLAGLWREVMRLDRVGVEDNFFELGGNSILGAVLINRLQEKLGERVPVVALFDAPTVAGLARHLADSCPDAVRRMFGPGSVREALPSGPKSAGLLLPMQPEGSRPPCFLVHPPGGIVVCYQPLALRMGRERPIYGIRSRGLLGDEELPASLEEMAADYVAALRAVRPGGPYHLGGWSVGGLVALEMARQLRADGQEVRLLALLDTTPTAGPGEDDQSGREYGLDVSFEELARLGPDEQLPYLWRHALKLGLIDPDVPLQVARQVLDELKRLFHHHMLLANAYAARPYPGRITLIRPIESPVAVSTLHDRGWGRLAEAVDVHFVPGQHHSMVREPHVRALADVLNGCLDRAEGRIAERDAARGQSNRNGDDRDRYQQRIEEGA